MLFIMNCFRDLEVACLFLAFDKDQEQLMEMVAGDENHKQLWK